MAKAEEAINTDTTSYYQNTINALTEMRKTKGEAVGAAISEIVENNPMASVSYKEVGKKFEKVVKDAVSEGKVPFNVGTETISAKTVAADPAEISKFKNIYEEFVSRRQAGELTISYLQTLKGALQDLSQGAYQSGRGSFGKLYGDLSRTVNPAKIVSENPELAKALPNLSKANKEFASFIPQHDELLSQISKKDANGVLIPDIGKVMRAVEKNDVATIQRIWKSEQMLPKEVQILPKIKDSVLQKQKLEDQALATLKAAQKKLKMEHVKLQTEQRKILNYERTERRRQLFDLNKADQAKTANIRRALDEKVAFLERQQKARFHWPDFKISPTGHLKVDPREVISPVPAAFSKAAMFVGKKAQPAAAKAGAALDNEALKRIIAGEANEV